MTNTINTELNLYIDKYTYPNQTYFTDLNFDNLIVAKSTEIIPNDLESSNFFNILKKYLLLENEIGLIRIFLNYNKDKVFIIKSRFINKMQKPSKYNYPAIRAFEIPPFIEGLNDELTIMHFLNSENNIDKIKIILNTLINNRQKN